MNVVTKKGDRGMSSLCGGRRLAKDHLRFEICGTLDELSCFLGLSRSLTRSGKVKKIIASVQRDLFIIGAEAASETKTLSRLKQRIDEKHILTLETYIEDFQKHASRIKKSFYLPGGSLASGYLDISRAITRRLERRMVSAGRKNIIKNNLIIKYLNRLSDLLFILARAQEKKR
jgi:ATP:cob(I)alamin adenosyltransferase